MVFFFCLVFAMSLCASVCVCFVVACWERAGLLALVCGAWLWVCRFLIGILGQAYYLIVSIPDLCTLTYFDWEGWTIIEKKTNHKRLQTNEGTDCIKEKRRNNTHREGWTIIEKLTTGACRLMKEWTKLKRRGRTMLRKDGLL